jgi:hypothetical protein
VTCGVAAGCLVTASTVPYARCLRSEGLLALREHPGAACQYPMARIPGLRLLLTRVQTDACLHFGFNPASPRSIYRHLPGSKFALNGCFVILGAESCGLKIRVSMVRFHPWPPSKSFGYDRRDYCVSVLVPIWCPLPWDAASTAIISCCSFAIDVTSDKRIFRYWVEVRELASGSVRKLPLTGMRLVCLARGKRNEPPVPDKELLRLTDDAETWEVETFDELRVRLRDKYPDSAFERTLISSRTRRPRDGGICGRDSRTPIGQSSAA